MGTCRACRWWGHESVEEVTRFYETEAKACGCPALLKLDEEPGFYSAVKGNGWGLDYPVCDLITGPDFGCVHWEERPPA